MGLGKTYSTKYLVDSNGNTGAANQVLVSTATGVDWVDGSGSGIIGGPYLPLTAGASYPLTGDLYVSDDILPVTNIASNLGSSTNSFLYTHTYVVQSAGVLQLNAGGSERMRIGSSGNVGIGTTSPAAGLQVAKGGTTIPVAGSSTASAVFGNSTSDDNYGVAIGANSSGVGYISSQRTDGNATTYNLAIQPNGGNVGIGTTSPNTKLQVSALNSNYVNLTGGFSVVKAEEGYGMYMGVASSGNSWIQSATYDNGITYPLILNSAGGNVGIGTASPSRLLQLNSSGQTDLHLTSTNQGVGASDGMTIFLDASGTGGLWLREAAALRFATSSSEKMRIDSSGNVGIGTTAPATKLHVNGDIGAYTSDWVATVSGSRLLMKTFANTGDTYSLIQAQDVGGNSNNALALQPYGDNVGIGTTSPSAKLDVNGAFYVTGNTGLPNGVAPLAMQFTSPTGRIYVGDGSGYDLRFSKRISSVDTDFVTIKDNGNVGIGTTTPAQKLEVVGSIGFSKALYSDIGTNGSYIAKPWGGDFLGSFGATQTGAIKIVLPTTTGEDDMIKFTIDVYQYATNQSFSVDVGCYVFQAPGGTTLTNCTAIVNAKLATQNWTVRFGDDGTNHCIWVGELNTVWNYPQIVVRDFMGGFITQTEDYLLEWDVTFEATAFEDVQTTLTNNFPLSGGGVDGPYLPLSAGSSYPLTGTLHGTSTNFSGSGDYAGSMTLGTGASTAEANLQIGHGRTGNGYSYIDLIGDATYADFGLRIIRSNTGANTSSSIIHRGTGNFGIATIESSSMILQTNSTNALTLTNTQNAIFTGNVGIGTTSPGAKLDVNGTISASGEINSISNNARISLYRSTGTNYFDWSSGQPLYFSTETTAGGSGRSTKMVLLDNGNVGIGTTNPQGQLSLDNQITNSGTPLTYSTVQQNVLNGYYTTGESPNLYMRYFDIACVGDGDGTNGGGNIRFLTNPVANDTAVERMRITSDGNVGIGTTGPSGKLHIKGAAANWNLFGEASDGSQLYGFYEDAGAGQLQLMDASGVAQINLQARAGQNNYINGGNVGIGTTSPTSLLSVGNAATFNYPPTTVNIATTDTGAYLLKVTSDQFNVAGNWVGIGLGYSNQYMKMGIIAEAKDSSRRGKLHFAVKTTSGSSNAGISDAKMTIDDTGRVGIGTPSPAAKLEVRTDSGGSASNSYFRVTAAVDGAYGGTSHFEGAYNDYVNVNQPNIVGKIEMSSQVVTATNVGGTMKFFTKATGGSYLTAPLERMRIDSSGNVGIGITSPGAKLDVYNSSGNVYQAFIGGSVSKLMINGNLSGGGVALQSAAANSSSDYSICPSTVYDLFMQSCGGNVMIGSGTPTAKLEVNGQTKTKSLTYLEPTGDNEYRGEIVYFGAFESGEFDTNGGELVCLGSTGGGTPVWRKADDTTLNRATGMLGITLGTTVASGVLVRGFARSAAYSGFSDGGKCYISATSGDMTTTAPTGNNKYLRIVGYVVDSITGAAEIYFCPDNTYVQITV